MIVSGSVPMATTMPIALYNAVFYGSHEQAMVLALVQLGRGICHTSRRQPPRQGQALVGTRSLRALGRRGGANVRALDEDPFLRWAGVGSPGGRRLPG